MKLKSTWKDILKIKHILEKKKCQINRATKSRVQKRKKQREVNKIIINERKKTVKIIKNVIYQNRLKI